MHFIIKVIVGLISVSYVVLIAMIIGILVIQNDEGKKIFHDSDFFNFDNSFTILGIQFNDRGQMIVFVVFFFVNSLLYYINIGIIVPLFNQLIIKSNSHTEMNKRTQTCLFFLLVVYDLWASFRNFFSIIGLTSHISFMLANTLGYLVGDIFVKYRYISSPQELKFDFLLQEKHTIHGEPSHGNHVSHLINNFKKTNSKREPQSYRKYRPLDVSQIN